MEDKDLNAKFKEEVNKRFEELFHKIGNNRQQLANKVIGVQQVIIKELHKVKVDTKRQQEIMREVSATEKMAAKQLPHLFIIPPRTTTAPVAEKKPAPEKKAAEEKKPAAEKKAVAKKKPIEEKKSPKKSGKGK